MKLPKIKIKKIKDFLKRLPKILGTHAFLSFLALVFFALIFGGIVFYKYSISAQKKELEPSEQILKFEEKTYQQVLEAWEEKERKFKETDTKKYPELFQETREVTEAPEQPPPEETPEETPESPEVKKLQETTTLEEFYRLQGQYLPPVRVRANTWEEKGLGSAAEYQGSVYQNLKLLAALKKELTE